MQQSEHVTGSVLGIAARTAMILETNKLRAGADLARALVSLKRLVAALGAQTLAPQSVAQWIITHDGFSEQASADIAGLAGFIRSCPAGRPRSIITTCIEISMKKILTSLLACAALSTFSAVAADRPAAALPGHYYLQGVTEVGSELLLKKDGTFEWMLSYGAVDQQASGSWRVAGNDVTLVAATGAKPLHFRVFEERELRIKKGAAPGSWVATVGVPEMGPVGGVEVRFEAKSGKTATAVSVQNGDAIVKMPASEQWSRVGMRREGSQDAFQWLAVPAIRAGERIAGFAITNPDAVAGPAFKELTLRIVEEGLKVADPDNGLARGVYAK
jgi:hypothetical protein